MTFASPKQILILIALTCLGLYALDYWKNPQLRHSGSVATASSAGGLTTETLSNSLFRNWASWIWSRWTGPCVTRALLLDGWS